VTGDVFSELGHEVVGDRDAQPFAVLGVLLDLEPGAGVLGGLQVDHDAGDEDGPGGQVEVPGAQFGQLAPAQAGLDVGLDQGLPVDVVQGLVQALVVRRRHDRLGFAEHCRGLDAASGVQGGDLVVERGGQDGVQADLRGADRGRADPGVGEVADPVAHVPGHQVLHPHRAQVRQHMLVDHVGVGLAGGVLHHVVG
jgi:hypothetical protein